jgi:hypothetical protein
MTKKSFLFASTWVLFSFLFFSIAKPIHAQSDFVGVSNVNPNYNTLTTIKPSNYVSSILNILLGSAGVLSLVYLIWGGLNIITAGGDKEGAEKGRKKVTNALIGLTIVFSVYVIFFLIRILFNIDLIQSEFSPLGTLSSDTGNVGHYGSSGAYQGNMQTGLVGNSACGGCIDGGCGVTGQQYIGAPTQTEANPCYLCAATGWQYVGGNACHVNACGTCH